MRAALIIAWREIRDGLRNRWVVATTLLLAALALTLALLGSAPTGTVGAGRLEVTVVSLASLTIFLIPLIALLLSFDAIVGEFERGTMMLLLTYPVTRGQIILGKFLGHTAILAFATVLGYGAAGAALALTGADATGEAWRLFAGMIGTSILLGAVFLALGYLVSAAVADRGTAAGLALGLWLLFVLLFDLALLGALVADGGKTLTAGLVRTILLFNPTDVYRLLNLTGSENAAAVAGMAGLGDEVRLPPALLTLTLAAWALLPLLAAAWLLRRRQL